MISGVNLKTYDIINPIVFHGPYIIHILNISRMCDSAVDSEGIKGGFGNSVSQRHHGGTKPLVSELVETILQ